MVEGHRISRDSLELSVGELACPDYAEEIFPPEQTDAVDEAKHLA